MELNIYHLYPDVLNLYGDRGNVLCMQRRLEWRGMQANVFPVPIGTKFIAKDCDLIFIGGGQDFEQEILMHDLKGEKTAELKAAIEDGIPVLAICGGYQMLGQYYKTWDGKQCDFTGALDLYTVGSEQRMIGNYMFTCEEADCKIVGFENHSGKTYLGSGVKPLGKILEGYGNNGEDGTEGAHYKNVFASYSHGCLLPKNPKLADLILKTALERKYGALFYKVFRSITVDNGPEFADCAGMERACRRKGARTTVYYCHPYSSWERGSNERQNGMIRRKHPKGTDFATIPASTLKKTEEWINNYPRKIFDFHTAAEVFEACMNSL